jgi:hypothetical protein
MWYNISEEKRGKEARERERGEETVGEKKKVGDYLYKRHP